jgi:1,4-dihydroxy-2-naphthoate octaprenyltransferase
LGKKARPDPVISNLKSQISNFLLPIRSGTWWEFKTPIILGVAYLSALLSGSSFSVAWPVFLSVLAAIIPLASYVCVINDITDEHEDLRGGKSNTMPGRSLAFKAAWLAACLLGGALVAVLCFRENLAAFLLYLGNWLVFTLYSVPPFRLKSRGLSGVLADACGGLLMPTLWAALLADPQPAGIFIGPLAIWAFSFGLRGILYHQASDFAADQTSGVSTFAVRIGLRNVQRLVRYAVFPLEVASLLFLLWLSGSAFAFLFLGIYLCCYCAMWKWLRIPLIVVGPSPRYRLIFLKYYQLWLPLGMIVAISIQNPMALLLIPAHAILFPGTWKRFGQHADGIRQNIQYQPDWEKLNCANPDGLDSK